MTLFEIVCFLKIFLTTLLNIFQSMNRLVLRYAFSRQPYKYLKIRVGVGTKTQLPVCNKHKKQRRCSFRVGTWGIGEWNTFMEISKIFHFSPEKKYLLKCFFVFESLRGYKKKNIFIKSGEFWRRRKKSIMTLKIARF